MTLAVGLLILFVLLVAALVIVADWRVTVPLLLAADLVRIGLTEQVAGFTGTGRTTFLVVEIVTALSVGCILLVTGLTFTRPYNVEQLDEFALFELRRAARKAQQQRSQIVGRWSGYAVPIGSVLMAGVATYLLGQAYPVAREPLLDAAWMFVLLCGLLILITANDALKLGLGMLLLASSAKLLYISVTARIDVLHWALLELLTLLLAVVAAYLSGLLYGRLHTLEFGSLFERR